MRHILVLLICLGWLCAFSQSGLGLFQTHPKTRICVEVSGYSASIWKHTPKLTIETGVPHWGQEIGLSWQTLGRYNWQTWHRYPLPGISLFRIGLGPASHGDALALLPQLSIPLVRSYRLALMLRLGTGVAYVQNPYDYFNNPGQNAIGSHWNNITQFRLSTEVRLSSHMTAGAGGALTHFSNGGIVLPNFGINLPGFFAGLRYSIRPVLKTDFIPANGTKKPDHRWGAQVNFGLIVVEYNVFDGPKYPIWQGSGALSFAINRNNRALFGLDFEFNRAVYAWGLRSTSFHNETEARKGATRLGISLADEIRFGPLSILLQSGLYIGSQDYNRLALSRIYNKLGIFYYLPAFPHTRIQPRIGIFLKAHKSVAEYISLNTGLAF